MKAEPEIVFRLGERRCSFLLAQVREVILPGQLTRVPRTAPPVAGVMNVRGRVALILDGGLLVGSVASRRGAPNERIVILDPRRRDLGIWVSEIVSIAQLESPEGRQPSRPLASPSGATPPEQLLLDAEAFSVQVANLIAAELEGRDLIR